MKFKQNILSLAGAAALAATPLVVFGQDAKLPLPNVSEELALSPQAVDVLDSSMTYLEAGDGDPVLFIHGNPTSSYLWRNIIPHVSDTHRAIAVDLIGMGGSGKPTITYSFDDHAKYLEAFIDEMDLSGITLVGHDWGAALAWDFAMRHPGKVNRLAFMEGVLPPAMPQPSYEAMGEDMGGMFRALRDQEQGYKMVMEDNFFVEGILPMMINRSLGAEAQEAYGAPYETVESRLPTWMWPREVPIGGEPARNVELMEDIQKFMAETEMPVLLTYAEPGVLVPPQAVPFYSNLIGDLEAVYIGQGLHFIQEDQPEAIGRAISDWLRRN
ncbi:haloalkane dehalogenase [Cognatishimia maritima]|uniref:Haloalkane dehalogenase n=1 Tax=Cognatishimia maritima TaxID=870908 RepID=A0A1M5VZT4_9RHOB|nr:haloalkane dehalogenase [Cognatishimia maritima]SHH80443.1 haloalkane dehalogenase [Cognatishimia maritima]